MARNRQTAARDSIATQPKRCIGARENEHVVLGHDTSQVATAQSSKYLRNSKMHAMSKNDSQPLGLLD